MFSKRESFELSGPLHLKSTDWKYTDHRRSVAACLVQGVYILEHDRQKKRQEAKALAPPWWEFFHFHLRNKLVDDADSSIFGAIYEFKQPNSDNNHSTNDGPQYVIAFRGTIIKGYTCLQDLKLNVRLILNDLHQTSRFKKAIHAARGMVATCGSSSIWLAGHSLGSAMAMLVGKSMAKTGIFLKSFLFNPPYVSVPIERIKDREVRRRIRIVKSFITVGLACATENNHQNQKEMEEIGAGVIERVATQHSLGGLVMSAMGKQSEEPLHLLPSANVTVNLSPSPGFIDAHGIHQWWRPGLHLESKIHKF